MAPTFPQTALKLQFGSIRHPQETIVTHAQGETADEHFCSECRAVIKAKVELCPKCGARQLAPEDKLSVRLRHGIMSTNNQALVAGEAGETPSANQSSTASESAVKESASEGLARFRASWPDILDRAETKVARGQLELIGWGLTRPRVQRFNEVEAQGNWYFIGDLHSDYLAWHTLLSRVTSDPDFRLCFLGDLIDRGPHHIECFAAILEAAERYPGRILWILGNHDEAVGFSARKGAGEPRYASMVHPSEFVDWLNNPSPGLDQARTDHVVRILAEICRRLPRAVLFPDGLLATHGGVPLQDRWTSLVSLEAFHHPRVLADFTWTRAAEVPMRLGWKYSPEKRLSSSDFDFGFRDLEGFAKAVAGVFPVKRIVRGHDHVKGGHELPEGYEAVPVLTLNAFGFDYITNSTKNYRPSVTLGIANTGQLPTTEEVPVPNDQYRAIYGE